MLQLGSLGRLELRADGVSLFPGLRKLLAVLVYGAGISRGPSSDNSSEASSTPGWRTLGERYIAALRAADGQDYGLLREFLKG